MLLIKALVCPVSCVGEGFTVDAAELGYSLRPDAAILLVHSWLSIMDNYQKSYGLPSNIIEGKLKGLVKPLCGQGNQMRPCLFIYGGNKAI